MNTKPKAPLFKFECDLAAPSTVERWLLDHCGLAPRSGLKRLFTDKGVLVNGRPATRLVELNSGDVVELWGEPGSVFERSEAGVAPNSVLGLKEALVLPELVVVNKPAGQSSNPLKPSDVDTTLNALVARYPETATAFREGKPFEGGLVHRLDRGTSGLLVCARTAESFAELTSLWQSRDIEKVYLAWLSGPISGSGRLSLRLAHDEKSKKKMRAFVEPPRGVSSWQTQTSFRSLAQASLADGGIVSLCLIRIHTGAMHQIRASFAGLGAPVVGDSLYAGARARFDLSVGLPLDSETELAFGELASRLGFRAGCGPLIEKLPLQGFFLHALALRAGSSGRFFREWVLASVPGYFGLGLFGF